MGARFLMLIVEKCLPTQIHLILNGILTSTLNTTSEMFTFRLRVGAGFILTPNSCLPILGKGTRAVLYNRGCEMDNLSLGGTRPERLRQKHR